MYPPSLANLMVEVGTRHSHLILLWYIQRISCYFITVSVKFPSHSFIFTSPYISHTWWHHDMETLSVSLSPVTRHWAPLLQGCDVSFLLPEEDVEQTVKLLVFWGFFMLMWRHYNDGRSPVVTESIFSVLCWILEIESCHDANFLELAACRLS